MRPLRLADARSGQAFSHRFLATLILAAVFVPGEGLAQSRTARTIRIESAAIGSPVTVAVLMPVDYAATMLRYPVLYLLHGGTQNHTAFPARTWFMRDASERRMIVVMPYLQPLLFNERNGQPAPIEEFLGRELPAYIDANYRTVTDRRARAIGGISMGGYGATLLGLKRPDMFGGVGAISAALSTGRRPGDVADLIGALRPETSPYFFIACGVADSVLSVSRELSAQLRGHQIRSELREVPGGHSWEVWDPEVK
jgi:S-formylglutathione hydrolase FrmB